MNWRKAILDFMALRKMSVVDLASACGVSYQSVKGWTRKHDPQIPGTMAQSLLKQTFSKHGYSMEGGNLEKVSH